MASWLDSLLDRSTEARHEPQRAVVARPSAPPPPEINAFCFQVVAPKDGDSGAAEVGHYSVLHGVVRLHDDKGTLTGDRQLLNPDDDARVIACRLAKAAWIKSAGRTDFNRRLSYGPAGYA